MSTTLFKHSVTNFYLLLFFIGLSISSVVLDIKYSNSNYIRIIINDFLITPIQYLASTPSTFFSKFVEEKKTVEQLKQKIEELEKQNTAMKINLPNKKSVQINIGSNYKTKVGQTVMGVNGLLGQVVEVNVYSSKVLLITDNDSNVPAKIARTGQQIIIKGRSQDNLLEVSFFPNDSEVESGDLIITSGQANRFIPSLIIGRVVEVIRNEGERFSQVIIKPLEDADKVSEVILSADER